MKSPFLTAEWRKLAIANYAVDPAILRPFIPYKTELDLWQNKCYVSLVGFMFLNTRIKGIRIPFTVKGNVPQEILLPDVILYNEGPDVRSDKGILVTTTENVEVIAYHYRVYFSDATRVLPESELDDKYTVVCARDHDKSSPSSFVVVSTKDLNAIEITPSVFTDGFRNPGVPFTVILNAGETYQIQAYEDLSGTRIVSKNFRDFAVFGGGRQGNINAPDCISSPLADNHLYEQVLPDKSLGRHFLAVPLKGQGSLPLTIVPVQDNTLVTINGASILLAAGQVYKTSVDTASEIRSDKPVNVMCYNKSQTCNESRLGDPSQLGIWPSAFISREQVFYSPGNLNFTTRKYFQSHFVNIACSSKYKNAVRLDGSLVTFSTFPLNPLFAYAQVKVDPGFHKITADSGGFGGVVYGFGDYDAYTYTLGYTIRESHSEVRLKVKLVTNPVTDGDLKLSYELPDSNIYSTQFEVYDAIGREVYSEANEVDLTRAMWHFKVNDLSAGTYYIRVRIRGAEALLQPFIKL